MNLRDMKNGRLAEVPEATRRDRLGKDPDWTTMN
jgi:hypothetical protein